VDRGLKLSRDIYELQDSDGAARTTVRYLEGLKIEEQGAAVAACVSDAFGTDLLFP
jgi:hypothetical protein